MEKGGRGTRKCRVFAQRREGMAGDKKAERAEKEEEEEGPEGRERREAMGQRALSEARAGGRRDGYTRKFRQHQTITAKGRGERESRAGKYMT